ncbi:MAG: hypothetical protein VKK80_06710 [Prochlorothrix sp.]|nr:hypothetical protein [Prochlorothrix sp.]
MMVAKMTVACWGRSTQEPVTTRFQTWGVGKDHTSTAIAATQHRL